METENQLNRSIVKFINRNILLFMILTGMIVLVANLIFTMKVTYIAIILFGFIILLIIALFATIIFLHENKTSFHVIPQIKKQNRVENKQVEKMITNSIFQAQEKERKVISRELHDGIGQSLFAMLLQVEILKSIPHDQSAVEQQAEKLQGMLTQTIDDVRNLSSELRPSTLDDFGLIITLKKSIQDFSKRFGIQINFTNKGCKDRLPFTIETALYRIAQEALINAAKYSGAERIDVMIAYDQEDELVAMSIVDYGKGFILNPKNRKGVGIYSMEERALILGGKFDIESVLGKGTQIRVEIPIE